MKDDYENIIKLMNNKRKISDLNNLLWEYYSKDKLEAIHSKNVSIGLFNVPCGGFGDIIVTKTFNDYLKNWYPHANITICTTGPEKYKQLGIKDKMIRLVRKDGSDFDNAECSGYEELKLTQKKHFDIMIVIPVINYVFNIQKFKKLIPYANIFNTFSVSEYNGEFPPYTFPIGVGEDNLGIFFNDYKIVKQKLIQKPYALVYIQPSPSWGPHSKICFISYLEMICKNYHKKYPKFQIIIPLWIAEDLDEMHTFYYRMINIVKKYYGNVSIISKDKSVHDMINDENNKTSLTFRADILPQKREIFISLMKDSIPDIVVTGDQSLTDIFSCCKGNKRVWYQIAPWKKGLSNNLHKHLPNQYFSDFRSSCGTLHSINLNIDWNDFMKKYDFRIHGRKRFDHILKSVYHYKDDKKLQSLIKLIEKSRTISGLHKKIKKGQRLTKKRVQKRTIKKSKKKYNK